MHVVVLRALAIGAVFGALAHLADATSGVLGAVFMGGVSSVSTWLFLAMVAGRIASSRRIAAASAATMMGAATLAYYGLRAAELAPTWGQDGGAARFITIAVVWFVGTVVGGAVVGVVSHALRGTRRPVLIAGLWIGVCLAPALAYLPDQIARASAGGDLGDLANASAPLILISAIAAGIVVIACGLWAHADVVRGLGARLVTLGIAALTGIALACVFRVGTDLAVSVLR